MGVRNQIFSDLGMILGPYFKSLFGTGGSHSVFDRVCFQDTFYIDFCVGIQVLGFQDQVFTLKVLQQPTFHRIRSLRSFVVVFCCFSEALGAVFLIVCCLGDRFRN